MAITQAIEALGTSDRLPLVGAAAATIIAAVVLQSLLRWSSSSPSAYPLFGEEFGDEDKRRLRFLTQAPDIYLKGYRKFKDSIFRITTARAHDVLVLPPKYLPELQKLPDNVLSFQAAIQENMFTEYTGMLTENPVTLHSIKLDLTPALTRLNPTIAEEVSYAFTKELGDLHDWTEININSKLLRIVALVSGRIFVGQELSRTEEFIEPAINFTVEMFEAVRAISALTPWKRRFQATRLPELKRIRQREADALQLLRPVVRARIETQHDPNVPKQDDFLQWAMDRFQKAGEEFDELLLAKLQLNLSLAAIHTTTMTTTNALYTLAASPDIVPELRQEIRDVLAEHGTYTSLALQEMKKLDSFIRETMRLNGLGPASFDRKVLNPFVLSTGELIPAGVNIQVPSIAVNRDDEIWSDSDAFDPLRYYKLRQAGAGVSARNLIVSVNTEHLTFGFGRHACPGRFFAANEMKMIMANLLLNYDIKLVNATERYPNLEISGQSIPDPTKTLHLRNAA